MESNILHYVDLRLAQQTMTSLSHGHSQRMSTWAHDDTPPPEYPYLKAVLAHSAAVQLYARSGQLATADILKKHNQLRSLLSPTVSERFCLETLISARNAASVKSEPILEIARNFSEHIPINSEQLVGITRIRSEPIPSKFLANSDHIRAF